MVAKKKTTKVAGKAKAKTVLSKSQPSKKKQSQSQKATRLGESTKKKKVVSLKQSKAKLPKAAAVGKKDRSTVATKKSGPSSPAKGKKQMAAPKGKSVKPSSPKKSPTAHKTAKRKTMKSPEVKSAPTGLSELSPQERYNVGGLCACVIDTSTREGQNRLERVLKHLQLSDIEQANLVRVSRGLRIPKLFTDGFVRSETRKRVLEGLTQFAKADDPSGKTWKTELEVCARLLGD